MKHYTPEYTQFLDNLKPGDKFQFISRYGFGGREVLTMDVIKRTPTQIVCSRQNREVRFQAKNGKELGTSFTYLPTPAHQEEIDALNAENTRMRLAVKLIKFKFDTLPLSALQQIESIIKEHAEKKEGEQ